MKINRRNEMQNCRVFLPIKELNRKIYRHVYENVSIPENHGINTKFSLVNSNFPILSEIESCKRVTDKLTTYNIAHIMPL